MEKGVLLLTVFWFLGIISCRAWFQWNYSTEWATTEAETISKKIQWYAVWGQNATTGAVNKNFAPRPRRGHSMVVANTQVDSTYKGETYILMFGGRDNDGKFLHIPKTYNVEMVNGTLSFTTYDQKPVLACQDFAGKYFSEEQRAGCSNDISSAYIDVGIFYNDVWAYRVCPSDVTATDGHPAERWFNGPCENSGWILLHPGAAEGGCVIELGIEVCTVPSERYDHAATMFHDGTMYVYGGFSQRCVDYCDDVWFFDIYVKSWRQVYAAGALDRLYQEIFTFNLIEPYVYSSTQVPRDSAGHAGPGRRWKHSMAGSGVYNDTNPMKNSPYTQIQYFALFGGHRLWHGYSLENSEDNSWNNFTTRRQGGYLDDLWIYRKYLDFATVPGETFKKNDGYWTNMQPKERCYADPGIAWSSRNDITCTVLWPTGRAGHGSVFDDKRNLIWIFGGYTTYFPYLSTDGPGSGPGVTSIGYGGFVPYPGYEYFLNDLWYYNISDGYWYNTSYPSTMSVPAPRRDMVLLILHDELFLHGGFADNNYFGDTWYFNITTMAWLQKKRYVYPIYPQNCTDDWEYISQHNCTHLLWPLHLKRSTNAPFPILPYSKQDYYWPDMKYGPYWPIQPRDFDSSTQSLSYTQFAATGTPEVPYAASGPWQYVKEFVYAFNSTHSATLHRSCVSVFGEPTRGKVLDGVAGRSSSSIFIAQPKNQRPGWDGCRDRYDRRTDLSNDLQYIQPFPRADHKAVFLPGSNEIIMYGGIGYDAEQPITYSDTFSAIVKDEMWYFNLFQCINNCSFHGRCYYGFCICDVGYYGEDCSNTSCPGTSCYYDEQLNQVCYHACQGGYRHRDNDVYVQDIAKLPCTQTNPGESNGICDGFGTTQCAPPFIGDDCSTKDCKSNCSFNGWCSVEYPVSRCMCMPGYFGDICEHKMCLNNCSYPNGVCNTTSGSCDCFMMYDPLNNTREFMPWAGEDCSYIFAWSAGTPKVHWPFYFPEQPIFSSMIMIVLSSFSTLICSLILIHYQTNDS